MVSVDRNNLNSQGLTNCSKAVRISTDDDIALSKIAIRQGTAENISVVYDNAINTLKQYQKNQGFINVNTVIKSLEQEKEFATNRLMYSSEHEGDFKREFKEFTGKEYNEDEMKELLSNKDDEASYAKAFGIEKTDKNGNIYYENNVINNALKKIKDRTTAEEWNLILLKLAQAEPNPNLTKCSSNSRHIYPIHNTTCPWCGTQSIMHDNGLVKKVRSWLGY